MGTHEEWMRRMERDEKLESETVFCRVCGTSLGHVTDYADDDGWISPNVGENALCKACQWDEDHPDEDEVPTDLLSGWDDDGLDVELRPRLGDEEEEDDDTTEQGVAFLRAIERELVGLAAPTVGALPGCSECGLDDVTDTDDPRVDAAFEGSFSWRACDSCGSTLGGDRYPAHTEFDCKPVHLNICVDCLQYHANGTVPDEWANR